MKSVFTLIASLSLMAVSYYANANDARSYSPMPIGTNLIETRVTDSKSITTGTPDTQLDNTNKLLKYTRYVSVGDRLGALYVILPYADLKQTNKTITENSGVGDLTVLFALGMYNMPALDQAAFKSFNRNGLSSACSVGASFPTGSYEPKQSLNVSGNRYAFKGECQVGYRDNRWVYELSGGMTKYGNNDQYLGNNTLKQNHLSFAETHLSYTVLPTMWVSGDIFYFNGGNIYFNDRDLNRKQNSILVGPSLGYLHNMRHFVKAGYQQTVSHSITTSKQKTAYVSYTYIW